MESTHSRRGRVDFRSEHALVKDHATVKYERLVTGLVARGIFKQLKVRLIERSRSRAWP